MFNNTQHRLFLPRACVGGGGRGRGEGGERREETFRCEEKV